MQTASIEHAAFPLQSHFTNHWVLNVAYKFNDVGYYISSAFYLQVWVTIYLKRTSVVHLKIIIRSCIISVAFTLSRFITVTN